MSRPGSRLWIYLLLAVICYLVSLAASPQTAAVIFIVLGVGFEIAFWAGLWGRIRS